jgi:hypothetical protein
MFTTNDSEITRLEGLYIKERNPPATVSGVFLGDVGVVGECVRGPVDEVIEITSEARFREIFGGRDYGAGGTLIGKTWKALLNKPFGRLYVVRAAAAAAAVASFDWETAAGGGGTAVLRIAASSRGLWGNDVAFKVSAASDGNANHFNLTIRYLGNTVTYANLSVFTGEDNLATEIGDDDGNLVVCTKLASGRPVNTSAGVDGADTDAFVNLGEVVASFVSVAGTDGAIADTDFTGTGKGMELLAAHRGVDVAFVAERSNATIKAKWNTLAATVSDRMFLMCADSAATSVSATATDAALYRSDRIIYCFNHPNTLDPETAGVISSDPTSWMASILSQTDVDIHPGEEDTKPYLQGITSLAFESLARADFITLREAGVSALERDNGFNFVSGVTTSLTPGKTEITRRRSTAYIQLSLADALKHSVKKKNTEARRRANAGMIQSFLSDLKRAEGIVEAFSVETEKLNTTAQRALGVEKILLRVKLLGHMLHLVLETEIGTAVSITELS